MPSSPISRLPSDLLLYIFEFGTFLLGGEYDSIFPILVSHVCSQWRQLALQRQVLWSTIVIENSPPNTGALLRPPFARTMMFLERSRQCPLTIAFNLARADWETLLDPTLCTSLANMIKPHLHRCKSLTMSSDRWSTLFWLLSGIHVAMPLLEHLNVANLNMCRCYTEPFTPGGLNSNVRFLTFPTSSPSEDTLADMYPKLRVVILDGMHLMWSHVHFSCLRDLSINFLSPNVRPTFPQLRDILLSNAHSLNRLELLGGLPLVDDVDLRISREPIHLPHVFSLTLGCVRTSDALALMRVLRTPSLTRLSLSYHRGPRQADFTEIIETLVTGTMCSLDKIIYLALDTVTLNSTDGFLLSDFLGLYDGNYDVAGLEETIRLPLRLYLSLTSLQYLALSYVDPSFIVALNAPLAGTEFPTPSIVFPLPTLIHLHLCAEIAVLSHFCFARSSFARFAGPNPYVVPLLPRLTLFTENDGRLERQDWRDDIDLRLVAERVSKPPFLGRPEWVPGLRDRRVRPL